MMDALTIDLMGATPLTEAEIQARVQDMLPAAGWPAWRRERAIRLAAVDGDDTEAMAFKACLEQISAIVDQARADSALLRAAMAYEAAQARLARPAYSGPDTIPGDGGVGAPAPESVRDAVERAAAQEVLDTATAEVVALVAARVPTLPSADPKPLTGGAL